MSKPVLNYGTREPQRRWWQDMRIVVPLGLIGLFLLVELIALVGMLTGNPP